MKYLNNYSKWLSAPLFIFTLLFIEQCKPKQATTETRSSDSSVLKISLAEWSIHRALDSGKLKAENFASIAKNDFGISAVEYVNSFYKKHATDEMFWKKMKATADSLGVKKSIDDGG